jgi:hypothetical protein
MVRLVADCYGQPLAREMKIRSEALSLCAGTEAVGQLEMVTEGVLELPTRCSRQRCFGDRDAAIYPWVA